MEEKTKKRLLILTSTFPRGGDDAQTAPFVLDLARSLREYYQVFILAPHFPGAKAVETLDSMTVYRFKYFFPSSLQRLSSGSGMLSDVKKNPLALLQVPFFLASEFLAALKIIRKERIDIINSHWIVPQGLVGALVKNMTGITHVLTPHAAGVFLLKRSGPFGRMAARFIWRRADRLLPVSSYIKDQMADLAGPLNISDHDIIPMGVDTGRFLVNPDKKTLRKKLGFNDKFTFLFVGKFVEKKGIPVLLKAARSLKESKRDFRLVLVGGGILEKEIRETVDVLGLSRHVELKGWIKNNELPDIYSASDVLVVPSVFDRKGESEGMPVVINEALACGVPVLASSISGIPDLVKDNRNGWLLKPGDITGLAEKMQEIMDRTVHDDLRKKVADSAEDCSYARIAERYKKGIDIAASGNTSGDKVRDRQFELCLSIHGRINVKITSRFMFYIDHFKKEYPGILREYDPGAGYDIEIFIDGKFPGVEGGDIYLKDRFKKVYPYKCLVKGISKRTIEVYFRTARPARFLYPSMAAVFLQAEIVEPLIYFKVLEKDLLMVHASGVFDEKGGYLFAAEAGAGKTTTAFHLSSKGFGFLGDDLIFLSKGGEVFSYPKRVHFFRYLKEKNPFLRVSRPTMIMAELRFMLREFLKLVTGKQFYFSTRLDIRDIMPSVRLGRSVEARRLFLLQAGGISLEGVSDKKQYYHMVDTCDTRKSLVRNILKGNQRLIDYVRQRESDIVDNVSKRLRLEKVVVEDVVKSSEIVAGMIKGEK